MTSGSPGSTPECSVEECPRLATGLGFCKTHYARFKKTGDPGEAALRRRPNGEGTLCKRSGYVYNERCNANSKYTGLQHRSVMEEHLGRPLRSSETVHHRNGIRHDNRIENLELWSSRHPYGQRVTDLLAWAEEILAEYAAEEGKLQ